MSSLYIIDTQKSLLKVCFIFTVVENNNNNNNIRRSLFIYLFADVGRCRELFIYLYNQHEVYTEIRNVHGESTTSYINATLLHLL